MLSKDHIQMLQELQADFPDWNEGLGELVHT